MYFGFRDLHKGLCAYLYWEKGTSNHDAFDCSGVPENVKVNVVKSIKSLLPLRRPPLIIHWLYVWRFLLVHVFLFIGFGMAFYIQHQDHIGDFGQRGNNSSTVMQNNESQQEDFKIMAKITKVGKYSKLSIAKFIQIPSGALIGRSILRITFSPLMD